MSRTSHARATLLAGLALSMPLIGAELAPLQCPAGSQRQERVDSLQDREEWCQDTKSGLKQGPARAYDSKGTLIAEEMWDKGASKSIALTFAGIQGLLGQLNAALRMKRLPWEYVAIDERKLRLDVTTDPPGDATPPDAAQVKRDLTSGNDGCLPFKLPGSKFETMEARYMGTNGKVWLSVTVNRADCERA
jgi:hypothetical protein